MDVLKLMEALGGEILSNKARVTYDGKVEIIGRLMGTTWEITERGTKIAMEWNTKQAETEVAKKKPAAKPRKTSK